MYFWCPDPSGSPSKKAAIKEIKSETIERYKELFGKSEVGDSTTSKKIASEKTGLVLPNITIGEGKDIVPYQEAIEGAKLVTPKTDTTTIVGAHFKKVRATDYNNKK